MPKVYRITILPEKLFVKHDDRQGKQIRTICLKAISNDVFESVLPKPEFCRDNKDFPEELLFSRIWSSCFGGASFLMFTTLSTILVPINTGLVSSLPDRLLGVADLDVLVYICFGGASFLVFTTLDGVDGRLLGVANLDIALQTAAGTEDLAGGVEERAIDLVGAEDLPRGAAVLVEDNLASKVGVEDLEGFAVADNVPCGVGVEVLEGLAVVGNVARPIVACLQAVDVNPPDDNGLTFAPMEEFGAVRTRF
ncbi:hypothetical protein U1Q18_013545 [Sarracenia purpurea var. burkii]